MKFKEMTHQVSCLKTKSNATKCAETLDQARAVPIFFFLFVCLQQREFQSQFCPNEMCQWQGERRQNATKNHHPSYRSGPSFPTRHEFRMSIGIFCTKFRACGTSVTFALFPNTCVKAAAATTPIPVHV